MPVDPVEEVVQLIVKMSAKDWNRIYDSIDDLVQLLEIKPCIISAQAVKVQHIVTLIINQLSGVLQPASVNTLVQNSALNVASENKDIHDRSSDLLDFLIYNTGKELESFQCFQCTSIKQ